MPEMMRTLEYLRGITPEETRRLRKLGVRNTLELLHVTSLIIDRERVEARTGIPQPRLLEFAHQSALLEISGADRFIPVLRRLGVTSQKDLKKADPADLHARLVDATGPTTAPTRGDIEYWISQARSIDVIEDDLDPEPPVQVSSPSLLGTPPDAQSTVTRA